MNLTKIKLLNFFLFVQVLFLLNCFSTYYSEVFPITSANEHLHVKHEYSPETRAIFQKKVSPDGQNVVLESGNLLKQKNDKETRVLKIEMKNDLSLTASDYHTSQFKKEKSNVLYFIQFDKWGLYQNSSLVQAESFGESDQVSVSVQEESPYERFVGDKITIQLNSKNQHKLASKTIDLYQIQLDEEVAIFHWELKKVKGNEYVIEFIHQRTGTNNIERIHGSKFKYYSVRTFYFAGKTVSVLLDIATSPIQLPFWIIYIIGIGSLAR